MSPGEQLPHLQAESDKRRIEFLRAEMQVSFTLAGIAQTEHQTGHLEAAERSLADAETGYATIVRFLSDPKHGQRIPVEVQRELRSGLDRLRTTLDELRTMMGRK